MSRAKSFYWGTDPQLYTGVANFSTKISASPTSVGLTVLQASTYATAAGLWKAAYERAIAPATRTKSVIAAKDDQRQIIRDATAALVKYIDAAPSVTNEQRIDLGLAPRVTPTNPPPPGTPYKFTATLNALGGLDMKWRCSNPTGGTMYQVFRKIGDGEPTYIGGSGQKKFEDNTLPSGLATPVSYMIQAQRTTAAGAWATFVVNIGTGSSGQSVTSVKQSPVKIAA